MQKVSRCDLYSRPNRSSGPLGDAQSEPRGEGEEGGDLVLNFFLLNIDRDRARLIHSRPVIIHAPHFFFFFYNSSSKPSLNSSSTTMLPDTVINIARTKARTLKLKPQDKTLHRFLRCEDREIRENAEQLRLLAVKVEFREQSLIRSRSRGNIVR